MHQFIVRQIFYFSSLCIGAYFVLQYVNIYEHSALAVAESRANEKHILRSLLRFVVYLLVVVLNYKVSRAFKYDF